MRLALVTWSYDTHQGISRCVVELANRLAAHYEVHVYASFVEQTPPAGVRVHRIVLHWRRYALMIWEFFFRAGIQLRRERFDLVHMHFPAWCSAQVFTCHGVARAALRAMRRFPSDPRRDVPLCNMLPYYLQIPVYAYHLRNRHTVITAVSTKARREVAQMYRRRPEEIPIIANGVDLDVFHPRLAQRWRQTTRARLGFREDQFMLLFVGHQFRHKGVRYAVETVARLPERVVLCVLGNDQPQSIGDPQGLLSNLIEKHRVVFVGLEEEVWRYYGAADALLFPSLYESFALVVLEAMAAGLPVITARTVALGDEVIRDGESGFVVDWPWQVEAMTARVRTLLEHPELKRRIGTRARQVAAAYSWDRYAWLTQAVYDKTLAATRVSQS